MDKEISKWERQLIFTINNRLRSFKRSTKEPRFDKYKRLIHSKCVKYSKMKSKIRPNLYIEIMVNELKNEITRVENLPKKKFTAEFGPKRAWKSKQMSDDDWLKYERTIRNEKRSKELHRPTL